MKRCLASDEPLRYLRDDGTWATTPWRQIRTLIINGGLARFALEVPAAGLDGRVLFKLPGDTTWTVAKDVDGRTDLRACAIALFAHRRSELCTLNTAGELKLITPRTPAEMLEHPPSPIVGLADQCAVTVDGGYEWSDWAGWMPIGDVDWGNDATVALN
jgi:hypothetical protein